MPQPKPIIMGWRIGLSKVHVAGERIWTNEKRQTKSVKNKTLTLVAVLTVEKVKKSLEYFHLKYIFSKGNKNRKR
jgi:hypothetical protein